MFVYAIFNSDGRPVALSIVSDIIKAQSALSLDFYKEKPTRILSGTRYEHCKLVSQLPYLIDLDTSIKEDGLVPEAVPIR